MVEEEGPWGHVSMHACKEPCKEGVRAGFLLPTGPTKPAGSGTGIPDRFGRKPIETCQIQIWIQKTQFNRFVPVYRPVWPVWIQIQI